MPDAAAFLDETEAPLSAADFLDEPEPPITPTQSSASAFLDEPEAISPPVEPLSADAFLDEVPGDSIVDATIKSLQNLPARAQRMTGGLLRYFGESPFQEVPQVYELAHEPGGMSRIDRFLTETGTSIAASALEDLKANAPDVEPGSAAFYVSSIIGATAEMIPALAASIVTRNPNVGLAIIGSQVFGSKYAQSREEGRSINESRADATVYAASEVITEKIPLGILTKEGGSALKRVLKSAGAEGLQEPINQAIQTAYDVGISEDVTFAEALKNPEVWVELRDAAIIGAGAGGALGALAATGDTAIQRMQRNAEKDTVTTQAILDAPTVGDAISIAEAALVPKADDAISIADERLAAEAGLVPEPLPEIGEITLQPLTEPLSADGVIAETGLEIDDSRETLADTTDVDPREAALSDTNLSEIMLSREVTEEETGDVYDIEESADVVLTRQKKRVEIMNKLNDCLAS